MTDENVRDLERRSAADPDPVLRRRLEDELFRLGSPPYPPLLRDPLWERLFDEIKSRGDVTARACVCQAPTRHICRSGPACFSGLRSQVARVIDAFRHDSSSMPVGENVLGIQQVELSGVFAIKAGCTLSVYASFFRAGHERDGDLQVLSVRAENIPCPPGSFIPGEPLDWRSAPENWRRRRVRAVREAREIAVHGTPIARTFERLSRLQVPTGLARSDSGFPALSQPDYLALRQVYNQTFPEARAFHDWLRAMPHDCTQNCTQDEHRNGFPGQPVSAEQQAEHDRWFSQS